MWDAGMLLIMAGLVLLSYGLLKWTDLVVSDDKKIREDE